MFEEILWDKIKKEENDQYVKITDLSGVFFPKDADFQGRVFNKAVSFIEAHFMGSADFSQARFVGEAHFRNAEVSEEVKFTGAQFNATAYFSDSHFSGAARFFGVQFSGGAVFFNTKFFSDVYISGARFGKAARFDHAWFNGKAGFAAVCFSSAARFPDTQFIGEAYFDQAHFFGTTDFSHSQFMSRGTFWKTQFSTEGYFSGLTLQGALIFQGTSFQSTESDRFFSFQDLSGESARRIRFEGVDLSQVSFLRSDISQTAFVGCAWAHKVIPLLWPVPLHWPKQYRTVVYDENDLDILTVRSQPEQDRRLVADLYRQLRLNFESNRQEVEAGDFYIGQMEMRRRDKANYGCPYRWLLSAYRVLSMYGESYVRPVSFYLTFGLLFALLYLLGGLSLGEGEVVRYTFSFELGNVWPFIQHLILAYMQALTAGGIAFVGGQSSVTPDDTVWWVAVSRYVNMLLDTFLLGFFLIALRRHFRR